MLLDADAGGGLFVLFCRVPLDDEPLPLVGVKLDGVLLLGVDALGCEEEKLGIEPPPPLVEVILAFALAFAPAPLETEPTDVEPPILPTVDAAAVPPAIAPDAPELN